DSLTISDSTGELAKFDSDGSLGERLDLAGKDMAFTLASNVAISGDFWFSVDNAKLVMAGEHVSANFAAAGVSVGVEDASFGLITSKTGGAAMEASGGFVLTGSDFAAVSADYAAVKYNTTNNEFTGYKIGKGEHTYTFGTLGASANLLELSTSILNLTVADFFTLSGDFGFKKNGSELNVISANANVAMGAGEFKIGVSNAQLGLIVSPSGKALEAKGGVFAQLGSNVELSAQESEILWKNSATVLTAENKTLATAGLTYTFGDEIVASSGIEEVRVSGAVLKAADFFRAGGNFAFHKSSTTLQPSEGTEIQADLLTIGASNLDIFAGMNGGTIDAIGLALSGASFALALMSDKEDSSRRWTALK
ncbi:MAG: hypothetical protein U0946_07060, partial [Patescibacteria group bacterium]|nr:hypothetical protein [Patescibacteria group bacterium]